ncbi:hypothetical protein AB0B86_26695 [Micromonospora sp. NPDC049047]|uniref:hypothetical protein n=1 Tax=Micromonospora sp. NPDC049047 TaxID=3155645 RepID=UPI003411DDD2
MVALGMLLGRARRARDADPHARAGRAGTRGRAAGRRGVTRGGVAGLPVGLGQQRSGGGAGHRRPRIPGAGAHPLRSAGPPRAADRDGALLRGLRGADQRREARRR